MSFVIKWNWKGGEEVERFRGFKNERMIRDRKSSRKKDGEKRKKESELCARTISENVRKSEALNLSSEENY